MESSLSALQKYFPSFPIKVLRKIYQARCERFRVFMYKGIPDNVRWLIEAKVRSAGEVPEAFFRRMPGFGKSAYAKKRRAKRLGVCHKCGWWICNTKCRYPGAITRSREDRMKFIKNGLRKESLEDIREALETHSCGIVQFEIVGLWLIFEKERDRYSLGNLTLNDPVCQFVRKLDEMQIADS